MTTLEQIASNGQVDDWSKTNSELSDKLNNILSGFYGVDEPFKDPLTGEEYNLRNVLEELKTKLETNFEHKPPFTIQRLTELILYPRKYYSRTSPDKLIKALTSVLSVSTDTYPKVDFDHEVEQDQTRAKSMISEVTFTPIPWTQSENSSLGAEDDDEVEKIYENDQDQANNEIYKDKEPEKHHEDIDMKTS